MAPIIKLRTSPTDLQPIPQFVVSFLALQVLNVIYTYTNTKKNMWTITRPSCTSVTKISNLNSSNYYLLISNNISSSHGQMGRRRSQKPTRLRTQSVIITSIYKPMKLQLEVVYNKYAKIKRTTKSKVMLIFSADFTSNF